VGKSQKELNKATQSHPLLTDESMKRKIFASMLYVPLRRNIYIYNIPAPLLRVIHFPQEVIGSSQGVAQ